MAPGDDSLHDSRRLTLKSDYVSPTTMAIWYFRRGIVPALRGAFRAWLYGRVGMPLAMGRGVRVFGGRQLRLGKGVVIGDYCWFSCTSQEGVELGDNVTIREFGWIQCSSSLTRPLGVSLRVGSGTYIGPRCYIGVSGRVSIGTGCDIGGSFTLLAENHVIPGDESTVRSAGTHAVGITVGNHCWIGNNVTILDGVNVGDGCVIGAGAVVTRDLPPRSVAFGVPARVARVRD